MLGHGVLRLASSTSYWRPASVLLAPSVHEIWVRTLGRASTVIGVFLYQLFADSRKGFREDFFWRQIFWLMFLAQFTQILGLQNISYSHWYLHRSPEPFPRKMPGSPRLIYVDDTSPLISYQGKWDDHDGDNYTVNSQWGPPFQNTLHALTGSGSFTFNFTGK